MNSEEGEHLVRFAREAVEDYLDGRSRSELLSRAEKELSDFKEPRGVFVTINSYPERELRGCIGFPEPFYPLNESLTLASISAATEDPRFLPLSRKDQKSIVFEITVLTEPEKIEYENPEDLIKQIVVGRDGLIAEKNGYRGLLLPQVPVEWSWDTEEFLSQTCWKAGLPKKEWKKGTVSFYRFTGEIFAEKEPGGEVERIIPELSHQ